MYTKISRCERVEARVTREQKKMFIQCAQMKGCSLSDFVVSSAQEVAQRIMREQETMALSEKDRQVFVTALLKEEEPNEKLKIAADRYMQGTR
ncbi:MAG: DUF1778 domain-containing protein [Desulfohalobiaceae bacterium]|nr:DUF1778 domain-containing protein [Desulfohalobiaceae bacterium]